MPTLYHSEMCDRVNSTLLSPYRVGRGKEFFVKVRVIFSCFGVKFGKIYMFNNYFNLMLYKQVENHRFIRICRTGFYLWPCKHVGPNPRPGADTGF